MSDPRWVLASTSRYRAALLARAGIDVELRPPSFDERALDARFAEWGVDRYVVEVARGKARSVIGGVDAGTVVVAADQVAVLDGRLLTKPRTPARAVDQLMGMSGRTHELVNGVFAIRAPEGPQASAVDRHVVTMRPFSRKVAEAYVSRFEPLDCVGAYRIEDDADLIEAVDGSGDDGVIGMPIALVRDLVARVGGPGGLG